MQQNVTESNNEMILRIAVGSQNPAKIGAVERALKRCLHDNVTVQISGFNVPSGVPDQPFGDLETLVGGKNRAKAAYEAYQVENKIPPDIAVGMEGGLEWMTPVVPSTKNVSSGEANDTAPKLLSCMAWMAIYGQRSVSVLDLFASESNETTIDQQIIDTNPIYGISKSATFTLPPMFSKYILDGMELGSVDDLVFSRINSKHGQGTIGKLTNGVIDRSAYYEHCIIMALIPWIHPSLYPNGIEL